MKIEKIECPSCGYSFNLDNIDENSICECPACKSSLHIDDEKDSPTIVNININNYGVKANESAYFQEQKSIASKIGAIVWFVFIIGFIAVYGYYKLGMVNPNSVSQNVRTQVKSEPVIEFVESVFEKELSAISAEDYEKIAYLHIKRDYPISDRSNADMYPWRFDYAYSVDDEGTPIDKKSVLIYSDKAVEQKDAQVFTNLIRLEFGEHGNFEWDNDSYSAIDFTNLENLQYYTGDMLAYFADAFNNPNNMKGLHIYFINDPETLKLLSQFNNIESITIDYLSTDGACDLNFLSTLTKLKSLDFYLSSDTTLANYDVFYALPHLEKLSLKNIPDLKNIDFVKNMPKLYSLELNSAAIMDIEALKDKISLTELSLIDLDAVKDLATIQSLSSLKKLTILDMDAEAITLGSLTNLTALKDVAIEAKYIDSFAEMSHLENLELKSYFNSNPDILLSLNSLKKLKIDLSGDVQSIAYAISNHPNLKSLECNLNYKIDDFYLTALFNSKSIENLIINNDDFILETMYIDFNNLQDNNTLQSLSLNRAKIFAINENNGEHKLSEYADRFLSHFKAIEELYLQKNEIKSLDFVKNMPNLRVLDISDNYVTDVKALLACQKLDTLICKMNPISNLNMLPKSITIIKE